MVFLHGGAFVYGEGSLYDPTELAAQGNTIVVTINYRLGILGYMANPALSAGSFTRTSGNYGLLDQQFALRWVQEKIAAFGGNPANVTVFGESAGGFSVCALIASPSAAGLFQRAITESGPCSFTLPTLSAQEAQGTKIAGALGCAGSTPAETAACLRSASVARILAEESTITSPPSISALAAFFPNVDGILVPQQPATLLTLGAYNHVPVMEGTNGKEGSLFVALAYDLNPAVGPLTAAGYPAAVGAITASLPSASSKSSGSLDRLTTQILNQYPLGQYSSPGEALAAMLTDAGFSCQAAASNQLLAPQVPTFAYELADPGAPTLFLPPVSFPYGPTHTDELPYLFSFSGSPAAFTSDQRALASTMKAYWTNFASTGNPNGRGVAYWPASNTITNPVQSLSAPTPATTSTFATEHHCSFWSNLILQAALLP